MEKLRDNLAARMEVETEEECSLRLEHTSHMQQPRLSSQTDEERADRLSAAQDRSQAKIQLDSHLPMLEQQHVQTRMHHFHQKIRSPVSGMLAWRDEGQCE